MKPNGDIHRIKYEKTNDAGDACLVNNTTGKQAHKYRISKSSFLISMKNDGTCSEQSQLAFRKSAKPITEHEITNQPIRMLGREGRWVGKLLIRVQ
jgi:hypothetical protein